MSEQLNNILWMSEELDFELAPDVQAQAENEVRQFLESAGSPELRHWVYPA